MRKTISLLALALVLCLSGVSFATDSDFDDLFGDDLFADLDYQDSSIKPEEVLLVNEDWEMGGNYHFSVNASRVYGDKNDPFDSFNTRLGGQVYLDARPDPNFRVLGKIGLDIAVTKLKDEDGVAQDPLKLRLVELFSDFNYDNKVFFRAGKQNVKWGVGYFFSPADVINIGRLDPLNPGGDREGPVALKVHYPHGSNNYYLYTLFDGVDQPRQIALAPKMEYVLGKSEVGVGGFYQQGKAPRVMLTLSSSFGEVGLFGEAMLSFGSDKGFLEPSGPFYEIVGRDDLFFQATAGGLYSYKDSEGLFNFTGALQYYFNGEGYKDQGVIRAARLGQIFPANPDKINLSDFLETGRHYLGATVVWNKVLGSKFSNSIFLLTNLQDRSGLVTNTISLPSFSKISPSVGVSFNFGETGSEYAPTGKNTKVFATVTIGSGSF